MLKIRSQRGSMIVEMAMACMVLVLLFLMFMETFFLVQGKIYVVKIAREGAREAAMTSDIEMGRTAAINYAGQILKKPVQIDISDKNNTVTCDVTYTHHVCQYLANGGLSYDLSSRAIYPWGR